MSPQRLTIFPIRGLNKRLPAQKSDYCWRGNSEHYAASALARPLDQVGYSPSYQYVQTNLRQVSIAVCSRLLAHLDKADNRHEHSDVPKPACQDIRALPSQKNG